MNLSKRNLVGKILAIIALIFIITNFYHHKWTITGENRGVIRWDVISYYAYLPATFIYHDLSLSFIDDADFVNDSKFWPVETEEGNKVILTSMGVSIMYSPFFFLAHTLAPLTGEAQDGFGSVYQFFLVFGSMVYVLLALLILWKILNRFFSKKVSSIVLILIGLGTNIYYYSTYEAAMSHAYSFSLIIFFFWRVLKWYDRPGVKESLILGLVFGLIVLIRPTNIVLLILLVLTGVGSLSDLGKRMGFLFANWYLILLMIVAFLIPWIPQFLYWHYLTGQLFFNAYSEVGSAFFFDSPQVLNLLFSFRKGWFIYVPLMFFAVAGVISLFKTHRQIALPVTIYLVAMIYILSSWWSWWMGGSFGPRSLIDFYGIMALPLAALTRDVVENRKWVRITALTLAGFLIFLNIFQSYQHFKGYLHSLGMTGEAYRIQFLRNGSGPGYWTSLSIPDFELARMGVYYYYSTGEDYEAYGVMNEEDAIEMTKQEILSDERLIREIKRWAERQDMSYERAVEEIVTKIHEVKKNGGPA